MAKARESVKLLAKVPLSHDGRHYAAGAEVQDALPPGVIRACLERGEIAGDLRSTEFLIAHREFQHQVPLHLDAGQLRALADLIEAEKLRTVRLDQAGTSLLVQVMGEGRSWRLGPDGVLG